MLNVSGVPQVAVPEVVGAKALVLEDLEQDLDERAGKQVPTAKEPVNLGMRILMAQMEDKIQITKSRSN